MRRLAALLLMVVSVACSFDWDRLDPSRADDEAGGAGPKGGGGTSDGGTGGSGGSAGAGGAAGGCADGGSGPLAAEFGPATAIAELLVEGTNADDAALSEDLLELYFNSDRNGVPFQIYRSTRACVTDPWEPAEEVTEVSTVNESTSPMLSPDALSLFVAYALDPVAKEFDIYVATRPTRGAAWGSATIVSSLNSIETDRPNWISADMLTIGLDSERDGDPNLYVATRPSTDDPWDTAVAVAELNTAETESESWLSGDGLTIYFGRTVSGVSGEIFRAERTDSGQAWNPAAPVDELNTMATESDPCLSPDGRYIVFTRSVDGKATLFHASR